MGVLLTRANLESELLERLQVADNSTLYPSARLTELIKMANLWATQFFFWDDLYKWLKTSTSANRNYYKYPQGMMSNSIMNIQIDGQIYERKEYEDFENWKITHPTSTKKIFASKGRFYFVSPTPTTTGSNNLHIFGCMQAFAPYDLAESSNPTIFSYSSEAANESIVKKGLAMAVKKDDPQMSVTEEAEAAGLLAVLQKKQRIFNQRNQRLDVQMFDVPNYFPQGGNTTPIGRFSYDPSELES